MIGFYLSYQDNHVLRGSKFMDMFTWLSTVEINRHGRSNHRVISTFGQRLHNRSQHNKYIANSRRGMSHRWTNLVIDHAVTMGMLYASPVLAGK